MSKTYEAEHIKVLKGLEPVRKRPGMYIGSTGAAGLHHLVYEVVDNCVDEHVAGYGNKIEVTLQKDGSCVVRDNGRGIPVAKHPVEGIPACTLVLTTLHAGGKFDNNLYKTSGGLHGVGISVVNALSKRLTLEIERDENLYTQEFEYGVPTTELVETVNASRRTGTTITFLPDDSILETTEFDSPTLLERFNEISYLNPNLSFEYKDERSDDVLNVNIHHSLGLEEYLQHLAGAPVDQIYINQSVENLHLEVAMAYSSKSSIMSYVNNIRTSEGGTHEQAFKAALTKVLSKYIEQNYPNNKLSITGDDTRDGLIAILSIRIPEPQFEGQTKTKLGTTSVKPIILALLSQHLEKYLEEHPTHAKTICNQVIQTAKVRDALQKAKELLKQKESISAAMPAKLADCLSRDPKQCELFLVEGDSAGGSAKQCRDRNFQSILPLRGKILNTYSYKDSPAKIVKSEEIKNLITVLGCGYHDTLDISKLRYHKVIIMTDSDVDGYHIQTLLLTLFYSFLKPVIEHGYLYIAQPPLYKVKHKKDERYLRDDDSLAKYLAGKDPTTVHIQRYKGLGEMNPDQLWTTTMDPSTRDMLQVTMSNYESIEQALYTCMGDNPALRRELMTQNASKIASVS